ncbi:recombinant pox virus viron protein [Myxoma virus]|uniref:Viron protein n=1 Tax=Myxoma virus TaxID=10273 RepID=A0A4P8EU46_9POXV|nr:recombinant pox virus viron protein [Myxoma virus]QDP38474.1 ha-m060 [Myxoma virus]QIJ55595.1 recombinant pox virus viron protein [Myxoma virus]QIJ55602.1 recombinant pox virus viron protein [Myxoma virus]QIJ55609.1 recombinant pox virus viron protein [Myxoma virus]
MDHGKYLLTIFLKDDESFFKYLSEQDDDTAMSDVQIITEYLDFLLELLIKSKDKLEAVGYYYAPLSEEYKSVFEFSDMLSLRKLFNKIPVNTVTNTPVFVDKGYLSDFVVASTRLKNQLKLPVNKEIKVSYIDPKKDITFNNILSILHRK